MKKSNITKSKKKKEIPDYKKVEAFLLMLFMLILPWITRLKVVKLDEISAQYFQNSNGYMVDLFLYYKAVLIIVIAVIIILMIIGDNIFPDYIIKDTPIRDKKNIRFLVCILIYVLMTIVSTFFSKYPTMVKTGSPSEFESMYVLIAYMVLFIGGMNYFCYESVCGILKKVISVLIYITIILNCVEFFYKPLLEIPFLRTIIAAAKYSEIAQTLEVSEFSDMTSLTFYNPNYYGGFCILLLPFALIFFLGSKKIEDNIIYGIASAGMLFSTFCAKSSASFYLMLVETVVIISGYYVSSLKEIRKKNKDKVKYKISIGDITNKWIKIPILIVMMFLMLIVINVITSGKIYNMGENAVKNTSYSLEEGKNTFILTDIKLEENKLTIVSEEHILTVEVNNNNLSFYDENGYNISASEKDGNIQLDSSGFDMISMSMNSYNQLVIDLGYDDTIKFYVSDGCFYGVGQNGSMIDNVSRESRPGKNIYSLFTGRGYAWVNTVPLLKDTIIYGHGPGTYTFYFQQNDYVGLMNTHGSTRFVIDKPHNMYLQIAMEEGCIAMLSIIILMLFVIINYIKNIKLVKENYNKKLSNTYNGYLSEIASASFVSVVAFMIYSIVNDSMVTVNPIFWLLLGINVSCVYGIKRYYEGEIKE